jgi:hypothetical protein
MEPDDLVPYDYENYDEIRKMLLKANFLTGMATPSTLKKKPSLRDYLSRRLASTSAVEKSQPQVSLGTGETSSDRTWPSDPLTSGRLSVKRRWESDLLQPAHADSNDVASPKQKTTGDWERTTTTLIAALCLQMTTAQ